VHRAMEILLEPLKEASERGVDMWCADDRTRLVFPLVAVFVGDFPEQYLMACVGQGSCPVCRTGWTRRGDCEVPKATRTRGETLDALRVYTQPWGAGTTTLEAVVAMVGQPATSPHQ
jgi:hypothetical protein